MTNEKQKKVKFTFTTDFYQGDISTVVEYDIDASDEEIQQDWVTWTEEQYVSDWRVLDD